MDAKRTKQAAQAERLANTPLTERQLACFEKSPTAQNVMVKRLIKALRGAWEKAAEKETALRREQELRAAEKLGAERPAVLIVVHCDGWLDVFADATVAIHGIELRPFDDETKVAELLTGYRQSTFGHLLNEKPRIHLFPHYLSRPNVFSDEALMRVIEWERRLALAEKCGELAGLIAKRKREEATP